MRKVCIVLSVIVLVITISISSSGLAEEVQVISVFQGENGKYGVLEESTNRILIEAQYDSIGPWEFDLAYVGFSSFADQYETVRYAITESNNRVGVINSSGQILAEAEWDEVVAIDCGYIIVKRNDLYGIVYNDVILSNPIWSDVLYNRYGDYFDISIWYENDMGWYGQGTLNTGGEMGIPPVFEELSLLREGFAFYRKDQLWGIVNDTGEIITDPIYGGFAGFAPEFHDGLARVLSENLYGYVDYNGKYVIPPCYSYGSHFLNGYAMVEDADSSKYGLIDKSGRYVISPEYSSTEIERIYYHSEEIN